jgi:hypothetical protein
MTKTNLLRLLLLSAIAIPLHWAIDTADAEPLTTPATRPSDDEQSSYALAKAKWEAQEQICLDKLRQSDEYKSALAAADQAKSDRAAATGDDVIPAAQKLMQATSAVRQLEQDALSKDAGVAAAKSEMNAAVKAAGGIELAVLPPINREVLLFSEQSLGKTIGNGECWTLGAEALKAANAKPPDMYVFGRELDLKETALPGDVIQFTSVRLEGPNWWMELGTPNHTAVIQKVESKTVYFILGQNPGPVALKRIDFRYLKSGTYKIYRALPG